MITLTFLLLLCLTACTPRIGVGVGGTVATSDSIATTKIAADSANGIHGSVSMGTVLGL